MIEKGQMWGTPYETTGREIQLDGDVALAQTLGRACAGHETLEPIILMSGDLHRSLGGQPSPEPHLLPIDLLSVVLDGHQYWAVAHVVLHRRWWSGECFVAMNASHMGEWNLGPKSHPNDGLVDVTSGALPLSVRRAAATRARHGTHVPHPNLRTSRVKEVSWTSVRPIPAFVDGVQRGRAVQVDITVIPDAGRIVLG